MMVQLFNTASRRWHSNKAGTVTGSGALWEMKSDLVFSETTVSVFTRNCIIMPLFFIFKLVVVLTQIYIISLSRSLGTFQRS